MFSVGRMCIKLAGRDAGKKCVIVELHKDGTVLVDGQTRRRKVNQKHLEPTSEIIELKSGADHATVKSAFTKLNIEVFDTKPKKTAERPKKQKKVKAAPVKEVKKTTKKSAPKKDLDKAVETENQVIEAKAEKVVKVSKDE